MTYDLQIYIVVQPCTWYMHKKKVKSEKKFKNYFIILSCNVNNEIQRGKIPNYTYFFTLIRKIKRGNFLK